MTARRGIATADGRRFVTGCTLAAPGSPPDIERDLVLVGLAAAAGVQFVHVHDRVADEVHESARDAGLGILDLELPRPLRLADERDLPDRLRRPRLPWAGPTVVAGFGAPPPATRDHHAMVVRFHVEAVRRLTRPAAVVAGPLWSPTADEGWSLLDADLAPKEAYRAWAVGARGGSAIADRLPPHLHGNEALALDVHVLDDSPTPITGVVEATLRWADGEQRYRYRAGAAPGEAKRVGTLQVVVPPVSGPFDLDVTLETDGDEVTSTYRSEIFADPHDH